MADILFIDDHGDCEIEIGLETADVDLESCLDNDPMDLAAGSPQPLLQYVPDSWHTYPYTCKHCKIVSHTMQTLREHSKETHGTCMAMQCADCDDATASFKEFVEHVRAHRAELKQFCPYCNAKLDDPNHLTIHTSLPNCEYCGEINPIEPLDHKPTPYDILEATNLNRSTLRALEYKAGLIKSWSDYPWLCGLCNTEFIHIWALRDHVKIVHGTCFSVKCVDCYEALLIFDRFVAHVREHRPDLENYCEFCDIKVEDENQFMSHFASIHKLKYKCNKCSEYFAEESGFLQHVKTFIEDPITAVSNAERQKREGYICEKCGKVYKNFDKFMVHIKHEDFTCDFCQKNYATKTNLINHILENHGSEKPIFCKACGRHCLSKDSLKSHVGTCSASKDFSCGFCPKWFKSSRSLRRHITNKHANRPFVCIFCLNTYKSKLAWKKHEAKHNEEFYCSVCQESFILVNNYRKHMKNKHGAELVANKLEKLDESVMTDPENSQYVCKICDLDFCFSENFDMHMQSFHGVQGEVRSDEPETAQSKTSADTRKTPNFCEICKKDYSFAVNLKNHMELEHNNNHIQEYTANVSNEVQVDSDGFVLNVDEFLQ